MFDRMGLIEYGAKRRERGRDDGSGDRGRRGRRVVQRRRPRDLHREETLREVAKALEAKFGEPRKAALAWKPQNTVTVDDEKARS